MEDTFNKSFSRRAALKSGLAVAAAAAVPVVIGGSIPTSGKTRAISAAGPISSLSKPIVDTTSGKVRGFVTTNGINNFRGIPYGAPTSGAQRFLAPVKAEPWAGVRSCLTYGHACPTILPGIAEANNEPRGDENIFLLNLLGRPQGSGEDCLRLNVWTAGTDNRKRPVMVFMHGGGYTIGAGDDLLCYDGENLARRHDVVVVTHNHRLNVYGFLNLAEMSDKYADSGNVGMLDQVLVLEWIRDNIANFGGDPGSVTIFGQSGGGGKVCTLMAMPAAKGLFHKAIVESGAIGQGGVRKPDGSLAVAVLQELGISRSNIEDIHKVPADRLAGAAIAAGAKLGRGAQYGPIADGRNIPVGSWEKEAPAISADVPLIVGTNLNEMVNGVQNPDTGIDDAELMKRLGKEYGDKAAEIAAAYRREHPKETPFGIWAAIHASGARHNATAMASKKVAFAAPVYQYVYCWRTPALDGRPGTFHSAELAMVFDNADKCLNYSCGSADGLALSATMSGAWTAFARTGNPNHPGMPEWPAFRQSEQSTMLFNAPSTVKQDFEGPALRLLPELMGPANS